MSVIENIENIIKNNKKLLQIILPIFLLIMITILIMEFQNFSIFLSLLLSLLSLFSIYIIINFVIFLNGPSRTRQSFNRFYASHFLSIFYKIFFPVVIVSSIFQFIFQLLLIPSNFGGFGIFDYTVISPSLMITFTAGSLITAIGIIVLSDYEMKKYSLHYNSITNKMSNGKSALFSLPIIGIYMGLIFLTQFILTRIYGPGILISNQSVSFDLDYGVNRAAKFWDLSTSNEQIMVLFTYFIVYIALEIFLRGHIARQAEGYNLGPSAIIFIPAIIQATAFTSGTALFSGEFIYYFYKVSDALLLGIVLGVILYRTGNFFITIISALIIRIFDSRSEFQSVILKMLPESFGEYNPLDTVISISDNIGQFINYSQIFLIVISPFIIIIGYQEVIKIISKIKTDFKKQWFGYLVLASAFIIIDIVFSFMTGLDLFSALIGFFIALLVIRFVLNYFFQVLPNPTSPPILNSQSSAIDGALPFNINEDIKFINNNNNSKWFNNSRNNSVLGILIFIYFLFLSATYRQINDLTALELLTFLIYLIILPSLIIGVSLYYITKAQQKGFFFQEKWRENLFFTSYILIFITIISWTNRTSTLNFSWRLIPIALFTLLFIWEKPTEDLIKEVTFGLVSKSRYATMRWLQYNIKAFKSIINDLLLTQNDNLTVGIYIAMAHNDLIDPEIIHKKLNENSKISEIIGIILAIGICNINELEKQVLNFIDHENLDIQIAAYSTLGKIGSAYSLPKMVKSLEENPKIALLKYARNAIQSIDPNYPIFSLF